MQRQFLLRPDKACAEAVVYCLAMATARYGIEVHAVTVMSNHVQCVLTDPRGVRPAFERYFHSLVARCMNVVRDRRENFWSTDGPNAVELLGAGTVLDKMVYVLTDPVRQHLVERVHAWPGVSSYRYQLRGAVMRARRPRVLFRQDGGMPEVAELRLVRPPGFEHLTDVAWRALIERRVTEVEGVKAAERRHTGASVLGRKTVLRRSPFASPSKAPARRGLRPRVASRDPTRRVAALERMRRFEARYEAAYASLRAGAQGVQFPHGTYQLACLGLVRCEPPPR